MRQSLSQFFKTAPSVDLTTCDQEQVHLSGMVQNIAALLVLDPQTNQIIGASENAGQFFGLAMDALLGAMLSDVDAGMAAELEDVSAEEDQGIIHEILEQQITHGEVVYDLVTHMHAERRFIEIVPNAEPSSAVARRNMRMCSKVCSQVMNAPDFDQAQLIAVEGVRKITGFSRVKVLKFLPDWSGCVTAESQDGTLPSFLGLHFPESDIPKQARELINIIPYRPIGTISDETIAIRALEGTTDNLDLTWTMMRSVSAMHTQYLRNMGIGATFYASLKNEQKLWGIISCHNTESVVMPFDTWNLVHEIGSSLMLRFQQQERIDTAEVIQRLRMIETRFASEMRHTEEIEDVIGSLVPVLRDFLRADGFAFQIGERLIKSGVTPPDEIIRKLVRFTQQNADDEDQFQTQSLHEVMPELKDHMETCCGVLVQPVVMHRVCQLIWFRGPITRKVNWAGSPDSKPAHDPNDPLQSLGPRNSFETWTREHRDQSLPWEASERDAAREIFKDLLDIIVSQLMLREENETLREFTNMAAHDIKAPLRGINMALDWMADENFDPSIVKQTHARAKTSAKRLQALTSSLLELTLLRETAHEFAVVDLSDCATGAADLLTSVIAENGGRVEIGALPKVSASEDLITRLFLNLFDNSVKFRSMDDPLLIDVRSDMISESSAEIRVSDNGRGIPQDQADQIFRPMTRLTGSESIEGSGLGLTLCKRIIELHGGEIRVDPDYKDGARFILTLPVADA